MTRRRKKTWTPDLSWAENPKFVAFMAHGWFAYAFVITAGFLGFNAVAAAVLVLAVTAAKEFVLDVLYEHDPPQTWRDGLLDWDGYLAGAALGLVVSAVPFLFWGSLGGR